MIGVMRSENRDEQNSNKDPVYIKTSNLLSNFLLLSENYESLAHETDPEEPEEDTDSVM